MLLQLRPAWVEEAEQESHFVYMSRAGMKVSVITVANVGGWGGWGRFIVLLNLGL